MLVSCIITIIVLKGNFAVPIRTLVEGNVVEESSIEYRVDFTKDLKRRSDLRGDLEDYKYFAVDKNRCVKL